LNKRRAVLVVGGVRFETVGARRWYIKGLWTVFGQVTLSAFDASMSVSTVKARVSEPLAGVALGGVSGFEWFNFLGLCKKESVR